LVRIGISGWRYEPWRGVFYPEGLAQRRELEFCGQHFSTVEINGSFYSLQRPEYYEAWYRETPPGFLFSVKGSRYITHLLRLKNIEKPLANFYASGILNLREKLGPFLWQFSPRFRFDAERFERFLILLPRDSTAAAALAEHHDHRLKGRAWTETGRKRRLRHAVEIRHPSFLDPEFVRLLRRHNVALVFADAVDWPYAEDVTADFCTCGCTARRSCMPAAMTTMRSTIGPLASGCGAEVRSPMMRNASTRSRMRLARASSGCAGFARPRRSGTATLPSLRGARSW